ncbi:MAG: hypothetical protein P1V20_02610 [Verrucomicrobiales bacterium]|nr:hypothetical protein [Verrucomicrobiales bacterium]
MRDELSIYFENPATDPLGHESVEGKLVFDRQGATLRYKQKDRAFRKNDPVVVQLAWSEVEAVSYTSKFFGPKILVFRTRGTDKLSGFPGSDVGKVKLHVSKDSRHDAKKAENFVEYWQSEDWLEEQDKNLSEKRNRLL